MRRFKFPFARMLRLREHVEEQKKEALGKVVQERQEVDQAIRHVVAESVRALRQGREGGTFDLWTMQAAALYRERLERERDELLARRGRLEDEEARAREEFLKARAETQVFERLRDRCFQAYRKEWMKEDQKAVDEAAGIQYAATHVREDHDA
ncbi:flagellar export protein FliJ [Spirochaeta thermophila DSM 6578]|uniref:Flagellar export protein FliJ n=1 Tax=Winmispira thermophila (strain ATCC 700085 / DSM 6578 / Z-1203) TaxID=869211 RepID=G0GCC8_WINT7|nr:flagellar FliJ family protein [Spirochaeta thermophila]AEJ61213.1 flagellar export protein FliJ [Spirochaeta thermophila DSM 6578]